MAKFIVNKWTLVKGSSNSILVILIDDAGVPYNISGLTALTCKIKKSDNSFLSLANSGGLASGTVNPLWVYTFDLTADQIAEIGLGNHDVGILIEYGTKKSLLYFKDSLTIQDPPMLVI